MIGPATRIGPPDGLCWLCWLCLVSGWRGRVETGCGRRHRFSLAVDGNRCSLRFDKQTLSTRTRQGNLVCVANRLLIAAVHDAAVSVSPLDRLIAAAVKSAELSAEADALIDHFVAHARTAGHSWTEIGERLGVTKQAVRERFIDRVNVSGRERFMPRLKRCVTAAGDLARHHGAPEIGTAHLLLALASNEGVACTALNRLGVVPDKLVPVLRASLGDGPPTSAPLTESPELIEALRAATLFAFGRGHNYVGTEHVLIVLASDPGANSRRALEHLGIGLADIKRELEGSLTCNVTKKHRSPRRAACHCSFCGTTDTATLVAGPGVWICHTCARIALDAADNHHA